MRNEVINFPAGVFTLAALYINSIFTAIKTPSHSAAAADFIRLVSLSYIYFYYPRAPTTTLVRSAGSRLSFKSNFGEIVVNFVVIVFVVSGASRATCSMVTILINQQAALYFSRPAGRKVTWPARGQKLHNQIIIINITRNHRIK